MSKTVSALRDLKIAINSEDHNVAHWQALLKQLNIISQRVNMRMQLTGGTFLEVVQDEKESQDIVKSQDKNKS